VEKLSYSMDFNPQTGMMIKRRDTQGYEICPEHGERLYGWRSHLIDSPAGGDKIDYSKESTGSEIRISPEKVEDRRDNRDPISAYNEHRADHASRNGHG
jgi:hypothetical protein